MDDFTTQGGGVKGVKTYRQTSTISHWWSSQCCPFLSPCPPPPNPSTCPPLPFPTASIVSIVTSYPHPPCHNQIRPSQNLTQSPLLFYSRCNSKIGFFTAKHLSSLTGNTWEALQWVILHQKDPEGVFRPFKVLTLACAKMFKLIVLYVGVYGGTYYYRPTPKYHHSQVNLQFRSAIYLILIRIEKILLFSCDYESGHVTQNNLVGDIFLPV